MKQTKRGNQSDSTRFNYYTKYFIIVQDRKLCETTGH